MMAFEDICFYCFVIMINYLCSCGQFACLDKSWIATTVIKHWDLWDNTMIR